MEKRKTGAIRSSSLPVDFLKMVTDVFKTNFDDGLKKLTKLTEQKVHFDATGEVFPEEIVLCVTLIQDKRLGAASVYASVDFDPRASAPTIQDLIPLCVDAIGTVFEPLLTSKKDEDFEKLLEAPMSAFEDVPFEWTELKIEKQRVYVKMDKANPKLDQAADAWLRKNDPKHAQHEMEEEEEVKGLFVTGPKKGQSGTGSLH